MRAAVARVLVVGAVAASCAPHTTEIVVIVDSDLRVPDELNAVAIAVTRERDGASVANATAALTGADAKRLPVTFSLERDGDAGALTIEVRGLLHGHAVAVRRSEHVAFVPGTIAALRLDVLAVCRTPETCPPPEALAPWTGAKPLPAAADAASDRGVAPEIGARSCEQDACSCASGARCAETCTGGDDCSLSCKDEGTTCELDARATVAANAAVDCHGRARCSLAGAATKDNRASCDDGAWCDVDCNGPNCALDCRAASCRLRTRSAASTVRVSCTKAADCVLDLGAGDDVDVVCNGASCSVTCRAGATCKLKCIGGAACLLTCDDPSRCSLSNCPPPSQSSCGAGVSACGRPCP